MVGTAVGVLSTGYIGGLLFRAVNIPPGATVTNAYINLVPLTYDDPDVTIRGEFNPADFAETPNNFGSRTKTTAGVSWVASDIGLEAYEASPDISPVLQEIIDTEGWAVSYTHLRMGQLKGVSGAYEWGLQAGTGTGPYVRFSDLRSEIHGTRLSLYAGDGGRLQVSAVDVIFYRTGSASSTLAPDADGAAINVETTGANYYGEMCIRDRDGRRRRVDCRHRRHLDGRNEP